MDGSAQPRALKRITHTLAGRRWKWAFVFLIGIAVLFIPLPGGQAAPAERQFTIHASSFEYDPGTIRVNPGDRVTLDLVSTDVSHGIYIDGYDLEVIADPGQTKSLSFVADRPGSYRLRCSVTCGSLHPFMIGKLKVGNNALYWKAVILAGVGVLAIAWTARK